MPSSADLLELLSRMSHGLAPLALAWHVLILGVAIALAAGWRPSNHTGVLMLAAPVLSVAFAALAYGNAFNGVTFGALALVLVLLGGRRNYRAVSSHTRWTRALGAALVAFGFAYPHFAAGWAVLYAPVGVVPCPTLAVIAGFTLLAEGFESPALPGVLTAFTAFYGLFGVARLGVAIDVGLFAATGGLAALFARATSGGPSRARGGA